MVPKCFILFYNIDKVTSVLSECKCMIPISCPHNILMYYKSLFVVVYFINIII